jgi:hypothetical protein
MEVSNQARAGLSHASPGFLAWDDFVELVGLKRIGWSLALADEMDPSRPS